MPITDSNWMDWDLGDDASDEQIARAVFGERSAPRCFSQDDQLRFDRWKNEYLRHPPDENYHRRRLKTQRRRIRRDLQDAGERGAVPVLIGLMLVYYTLMIWYWIRRIHREDRGATQV